MVQNLIGTKGPDSHHLSYSFVHHRALNVSLHIIVSFKGRLAAGILLAKR